MKVIVTPCCNGYRWYFRLLWTDSRGDHWQNIAGEEWTRKVASEALDVLEHVYGLDRKSVRFDHN